MLSITKFISVIIVFLGTVLLMLCYDTTGKEPINIIALGLVGLLVVLMGVLCWIWCESYPTDED